MLHKDNTFETNYGIKQNIEYCLNLRNFIEKYFIIDECKHYNSNYFDKTIQQMEQLINEQRGYIIQLQTMIQQRNSQLKQAVQPSVGINTNNFISVEGTIDL